MEEQILKIIRNDKIFLQGHSEECAKEITSHIMEFIEWMNWEDENDDFHFIKDYTTKTWLNADNALIGCTLEELYLYWLTNINKS